VFDFGLIKSLLTRSDFSMKFDGMHAVTGAYAKSIFVDELGASASDMLNDTPLEVRPVPIFHRPLLEGQQVGRNAQKLSGSQRASPLEYGSSHNYRTLVAGTRTRT